MTAPTADPVCLCGDPKSEHRLGKRGCKVPGCGCDRFEAAELATGGIVTGVEDFVVEGPPETVIESSASTLKGNEVTNAWDTASTSARLREVEAEVERLRAEAEKNLNLWRICCRDREAAVAEHELELAQLREQRDELAARVDELQLLLEYARDLETNGDVPPVEIHGWDAWQCTTCGNRYRLNFQHDCGPLTAVRVSITERSA